MHEPIPVLMYHSIAPTIEGWAFDYLSIHPDAFEDHISTLAGAGYVPVTLSDLFEYMAGKRRLPPRAVIFTFDDGYLDNWVFAFPIMRKHGFKGTVFASTDFVDRRDDARPNLDDVLQGRAKHEELNWRGFLSATEMKHMLLSEVMDIQGHCKTHTWYFNSPEIVDFHHPGDKRPWLAWNVRPERKPLYLEEDQSGFVRWGAPVYGHTEAVRARRYFPDPRVEKDLGDYVEARGGAGFFDQPGWRAELADVASGLLKADLNDRYETPDERMTRLREEIALSRQELESLLGKRIEFLCWPNGAYDDAAIEVAGQSGYLAWTLSSGDRGSKKNVPGEDPRWIRRTAASPWWYFRGKKVCTLDGDMLKHILDEYKGFTFAGMRLKWLKLGKLIRSRLF